MDKHINYIEIIFKSCQYLTTDYLIKSNIKIIKIDGFNCLDSFIIILDNKYNFKSTENAFEYSGPYYENIVMDDGTVSKGIEFYITPKEFYNKYIISEIRNNKIDIII